MKLEEQLKKLKRQKEAIEKEIENIQDEIYFQDQQEKTKIANERIGKWFKKGDGLFYKIVAITGNTYDVMYVNTITEYLCADHIFSNSYYPDDFLICSEKDIEDIKGVISKYLMYYKIS